MNGPVKFVILPLYGTVHQIRIQSRSEPQALSAISSLCCKNLPLALSPLFAILASVTVLDVGACPAPRRLMAPGARVTRNDNSSTGMDHRVRGMTGKSLRYCDHIAHNRMWNGARA